MLDALNDTLDKVSHPCGDSHDTLTLYLPGGSSDSSGPADDYLRFFPAPEFDVLVGEIDLFSVRNT